MRLRLPTLAYGLCALFVGSVIFMIFTLNFHNLPKATLEGMVYGEAYKPFVYRTLVPTVVYGIVQVMPSDLKSVIQESAAQNEAIVQIFDMIGWNIAYAVEHMIALMLCCALTFLLFPAIELLIGSVFRASAAFKRITSLLFVLLTIIFTMNIYTNYIYDFATLLLFTLGLAFLARGQFRAYWVVFVLACINKETAFLLSMVYAIHFRERWRTRSFWALLIAQGVVFVVIKAGITLAFEANLGDVVEWHLTRNLNLLSAITPAAIFALIGLMVGIFYRWREKPRLLRDALWIFIPLFISGVFVGYLDEIRIFYEVYPVIFLLLAHTVMRLFGGRVMGVA